MRIRVAVALLLLSTVQSAAKIACSAEPPNTDKYYAWRVIDGRKCYYIGEKGMDKDNLYWAKPIESPKISERANPNASTTYGERVKNTESTKEVERVSKGVSTKPKERDIATESTTEDNRALPAKSTKEEERDLAIEGTKETDRVVEAESTRFAERWVPSRKGDFGALYVADRWELPPRAVEVAQSIEFPWKLLVLGMVATCLMYLALLVLRLRKREPSDGEPIVWRAKKSNTGQIRLECPSCHGTGELMVFSEEKPERPPNYVICCHCMGSGSIFPDQRSDNRYE